MTVTVRCLISFFALFAFVRVVPFAVCSCLPPAPHPAHTPLPAAACGWILRCCGVLVYVPDMVDSTVVRSVLVRW